MLAQRRLVQVWKEGAEEEKEQWRDDGEAENRNNSVNVMFSFRYCIVKFCIVLLPCCICIQVCSMI